MQSSAGGAVILEREEDAEEDVLKNDSSDERVQEVADFTGEAHRDADTTVMQFLNDLDGSQRDLLP